MAPRGQQGCAPSGAPEENGSLPLPAADGCWHSWVSATSLQSLPPWSHCFSSSICVLSCLRGKIALSLSPIKMHVVLTGMAALVGHRPTNRRVAGLVPDGVHAWFVDSVLYSLSGCLQKASRSMFLSHVEVSLPLFLLSFPFSKIK